MRISDWSSDLCSSDLTGVSIALTPIYGITIPVIVRVGDLGAAAAIGEAWVSEDADGPAFNFDLSRTGDRSVYGDIEVTRPGIADPLLVARGIAVYPEVTARTVSLRVPDDVAAKLKGPVRRSEEHTSELQSLMRISYAVFCLKKHKTTKKTLTPQSI